MGKRVQAKLAISNGKRVLAKGTGVSIEQVVEASGAPDACACVCVQSDDAQYMMKHGDRIEIAYLPSQDMEEVRLEIERLDPNLVLCSADAFLDTYPARRTDHTSIDKPDESRTDAESVSPLIARREMRVLAMLAKGQTNDEIAKALRVSSRTVKRILSSLVSMRGSM